MARDPGATIRPAANPDAVVVAASTDDAKARQAIDRIQAGGHRRTDRDIA